MKVHPGAMAVIVIVCLITPAGGRDLSSSLNEVRILFPNGGEQFVAGVEINITWAGGEGYNSTLYFSNKSIIGPFTKIADNVTSPYRWRVPNDPTTMGYILVRVYNNTELIGEDTSDYGFVIMPVPEHQFNIKYPNGGEQILNGSYTNIRWETDYTPGFSVSLWYSCEGITGNFTLIVQNLTGVYNYTWIARGNSSNCFVKGLIRTQFEEKIDYSDEPFQIYEYPQIHLVSPGHNESVKAGSKFWVRWNTSGGSSRLTIDIKLKMGNTTNYTDICTGLPDSGKYEWSVPGVESNETYLRIIGRDSAGNIAISTLDRFKITLEGMELGIITGRVRDSEGYLNGVFVDLYNYTYGANNTTHRARTTTGSDGNFTFRELQPGSYLVVCEVEGYERGSYVVYVRGGGVSYANLTLRKKPPSGIDVVFLSSLLIILILIILILWVYHWRKHRER